MNDAAIIRKLKAHKKCIIKGILKFKDNKGCLQKEKLF